MGVKECLKEDEKCWACQMDGGEAKGAKTLSTNLKEGDHSENQLDGKKILK